MNKKNIILIVAGILIFLGILIGFSIVVAPKNNPKIDQFAKCLTDKKVVMYGAYWCSHCKKQKALFGESFKFVNYVECTEDTKTCSEKDIKGYPTWIFEDGTRIEGEASFQTLADKTSCPAP